MNAIQKLRFLTLATRSTILTLYRPFILQSIGHQPAATHDKATRDWLSSAERKATTAAMNTTNILSNMITADMIRLSQSLM